MYKFIDTTEVSGGASLPSEAMRINGEYIENVIEGYRTLSVSGREALSPDVYSVTTGFRDGSRLQTKRYPERIITVQYQLIAKDSAAFREAYNKLGRILDVENAELIFNDEDDKFFIGTPCIIGSVDPGKNAVVGEFEILCTDPFKYSVTEHEAQPWSGDNSSILIDYQGTYKAFPILEADFYSEEDVNADDTD
jgi:predicted phage tail component-like protein